MNASPALADGIYTARAEQADGAGNLGLSAADDVHRHFRRHHAAGRDAHHSGRRQLGHRHTPLYAGGAGTASGDLPTITINVYLGLTPSGAPLQTYTTTEAAGSWSVQGDTLPDGTYTVRAEQADAAGNLGVSAPHTFTIGTSYRDDVLSDSPAAYWRLGESARGRWRPTRSGTNNGTYQNGVTLGQTGALAGRREHRRLLRRRQRHRQRARTRAP